jgi:hypothetical protein
VARLPALVRLAPSCGTAQSPTDVSFLSRADRASSRYNSGFPHDDVAICATSGSPRLSHSQQRHLQKAGVLRAITAASAIQSVRSLRIDAFHSLKIEIENAIRRQLLWNRARQPAQNLSRSGYSASLSPAGPWSDTETPLPRPIHLFGPRCFLLGCGGGYVLTRHAATRL